MEEPQCVPPVTVYTVGVTHCVLPVKSPVSGADACVSEPVSVNTPEEAELPENCAQALPVHWLRCKEVSREGVDKLPDG